MKRTICGTVRAAARRANSKLGKFAGGWRKGSTKASSSSTARRAAVSGLPNLGGKKMAKAPNKVSSAKAAQLAGRVLEGYRPKRSEIETLAASVLSQRTKKAASKRAKKSTRKVAKKR